MKLRIVTPLDVAVDEDGVTALRAEDATGSFGILPGHADFLTRLGISVVSWTAADGRRHHCAVRGGVLRVSAGDRVEVATRDAVTGPDLDTLHHDVLERFAARRESEKQERVESTRRHLAAVREIMRHLQATGSSAAP